MIFHNSATAQHSAICVGVSRGMGQASPGANKGLPFDIPRADSRIVKPRRHGRASLHYRVLHILKMARASGVFKSKSDISDNLVMVNTWSILSSWTVVLESYRGDYVLSWVFVAL